MKFVWSRIASKRFYQIDERYRRRIRQALYDIGDPDTLRLDVKKLSVPKDHYRLRVGDYRIIYMLQGELCDICYIVAVKRRTSTTYLHEECAPYGNSIY